MYSPHETICSRTHFMINIFACTLFKVSPCTLLCLGFSRQGDLCRNRNLRPLHTHHRAGAREGACPVLHLVEHHSAGAHDGARPVLHIIEHHPAGSGYPNEKVGRIDWEKELERESCTCSNLQEGGCLFYIPQPSNQWNVCDLISSNLCVILYLANWCSYFLALAARLATVYRGCFIYLFLSISSIYHSQATRN